MTAGYLACLLLALTITEAGMKFMREYNYVGFVKSEGQGTFYSIAMTAQAQNSVCQIELEKANEQLERFRATRDSYNSDVLEPLTLD